MTIDELYTYLQGEISNIYQRFQDQDDELANVSGDLAIVKSDVTAIQNSIVGVDTNVGLVKVDTTGISNIVNQINNDVSLVKIDLGSKAEESSLQDVADTISDIDVKTSNIQSQSSNLDWKIDRNYSKIGETLTSSYMNETNIVRYYTKQRYFIMKAEFSGMLSNLCKVGEKGRKVTHSGYIYTIINGEDKPPRVTTDNDTFNILENQICDAPYTITENELLYLRVPSSDGGEYSTKFDYVLYLKDNQLSEGNWNRVKSQYWNLKSQYLNLASIYGNALAFYCSSAVTRYRYTTSWQATLDVSGNIVSETMVVTPHVSGGTGAYYAITLDKFGVVEGSNYVFALTYYTDIVYYSGYSQLYQMLWSNPVNLNGGVFSDWALNSVLGRALNYNNSNGISNGVVAKPNSYYDFSKVWGYNVVYPVNDVYWISCQIQDILYNDHFSYYKRR